MLESMHKFFEVAAAFFVNHLIKRSIIMRKTTFIIWLFLFSLIMPAHGKILIPAPPALAATAWILIDANTGKVLIEHNADLQLPPASLTKIMTSYLVASDIDSGKISEDDQVPISVAAWKMGGSKMFVREGTRVPVIDLLRGVVVQSGNDASVALAEYLAGSETAFADVMNQQAALLGMSGTHYNNATGWPDEGHVTTARDLALLSRALIQNHPRHYGIYAEKYFKFNGINQPNRNRLLWRDSSVDGLKTGHTEEAGYCLVSSASRKGMRLISVVMGASTESARAQETQKLLAYGFRYYETGKFYAAGDVAQEDARVWYGVTDKINLIVSEDVYLTIPQGSQKDLEAKILLDETIEAPISEGQELGKMFISFENELLVELSIVAQQAIDEAGLFARLWDSVEILFRDAQEE